MIKTIKSFTSHLKSLHSANVITPVLLAFCIATLIVISFVVAFPHLYISRAASRQVTITATGEPSSLNPNGSAQVWIAAIIIDNQVVDLRNLVGNGWNMTEHGGFYANHPASLHLTQPWGSELYIQFIRHPWSGYVQVEYADEIVVFDLFNSSQNAPLLRLSVSYNSFFGDHSFNLFDDVDMLAFLTLICLTLLYFLIIWLGKKHNKTVVYFYYICTIALFMHLLVASEMNYMRATVLLFPLGYVYWYREKSALYVNHKYKSRACQVFLFLINLYFTFAIAGNGLFMIGTRIQFSVSLFVTFIILFMILYPYGIALLHAFERIRNRSEKQSRVAKKNVRIVKIQCISVLFFTLLVISFGFYPGVMSVDGTIIWRQALNFEPLTNSFPASFTLYMRLLSNIVSNMYFAVIVQISLFSIIVGSFISFLYEKSLTRKQSLLLAFLFAILPSNYMMLMLLETNPFFSIFSIWLMYLLIRLLDNPKEFTKSYLNLSLISIVTAALVLIRHNGFLAVAMVGVIVAWLTVRYFRLINVRVLLSFILALAIIQTVRGPMFDHFLVEGDRAAVVVASPLLTPMASAMANNVELPEDMLSTMDKILHRDLWGDRFNRYNTDTFTFTQPALDFSSVTTSEIFHEYLRLLRIHPDIVVLDRLDNIESLWNIFQSRGRGSHNHRYHIGVNRYMPSELLPGYFDGIELSGYGWSASYVRTNPFTYVPLSVAELFASVSILDAFTWRSGVYIVLLMYLLLFLFVNREQLGIVIILPSVATLFTFVLASGFQWYRYHWFFALSVLVFTCYCLCVVQKVEYFTKTPR